MSATYAPQIVMLAGWAGTGKDLFGAYLIKNHGFHRYAFADPVKDAVAELYEIDRAWLDTAEGKAHPWKDGKTVRDLLIEHAELARAQSPRCWAKKIADAILADKPAKVVITDWRMLPEFLALQKAIPAASFHHIRCAKPMQRYSDVPDMTEYGLLGFPFQLDIWPTYCIDMKFLRWRNVYHKEAFDLEAVLGLKLVRGD